MGKSSEMWSQWDELKRKSETAFLTAKDEIAKFPGFKFKGCPDGVIWRASHRSLREDITARTPEDLVAKVKKEADRMAAKEKERAEREAARKSQGSHR